MTISRSGGTLAATTQEVIDDLHYCREIGIDQLTYDFRVNELEECVRVMEHLADRVLPTAERLGKTRKEGEGPKAR